MKPTQKRFIKPKVDDPFLLFAKEFCALLGAPDSFLTQVDRHIELVLLNINSRLVQFFKYPESSTLQQEWIKKNITAQDLNVFQATLKSKLKEGFYQDNKLKAIGMEIVKHIDEAKEMLQR